jgi:very-short-patch-repair endonuclease
MAVQEQRSRLISEAVGRWVDQLTDLTARNNLLYYKDLKRGTLDLGSAASHAREQLLAGQKVRCSRLFPDEARRADAVTRLREIHRKIRELDEERGISAGYVVAGLARWREERRSPAAPVLLRPLTIRATSAARDDFELTLDPECELNPVLLYKLRNDFRITVDPAQVEDLGTENPSDQQPAFDRLRKLAQEIPEFAITDRLIVGTFTYAKLPMVTDLREAGELLEDNDLIAALAGLPYQPEQALDGSGPGPADPRREFLVLDADFSQETVVNAVLHGASLVVQGPPGTGKSQTIANMIVSLIATGKRVLFVAEKRAAIDAVLRRLDQRGLMGLTLDIHDGVKIKRKVAEDLGKALEAVGYVQDPDVRDLHRKLAVRASRLDAHAALMNERREPWGVTLFDVQAKLMTTTEDRRSPLRVRGATLTRLSGEAVDRARENLREYTSLLATVTVSGTPWLNARITTREQAESANDRARALSTTLLANAEDNLYSVCAELGTIMPANFMEWRDLYAFLAHVNSTCRVLGEDVFLQPDLSDLVTAAASRTVRRQRGGGPSWIARHRLRKKARACWKGGKPKSDALYEALATAEKQLDTWRREGYSGSPKPPSDWDAVQRGFGSFAVCLGELDRLFGERYLGRLPRPKLRDTAIRLTADADMTWRLAEMAKLKQALEDSGLAELVADVERRLVSAEDAMATFDSMWWASIRDHIHATDPRFRASSGHELTRIVDEFGRCDADHLAMNVDRVRRMAAKRARDEQDAHPDQARLVRQEAVKKRKHLPLKDLLDRAPNVVLALKPCWATSPIVVSQKLPARELFDVVIFDEASQVKQADAIPAIMRARQVVVAGDLKQLPPTDFFAGTEDEDDEDDEEALPDGGIVTAPLTGSAYDSILETLDPVLPRKPLLWHYRSRDERLVGFSNEHFYDPKMITFPGIGDDVCLTHVVAEQRLGLAGQDKSVTAEVERVVELVLEHARTRPDESLGVITLGIPHMRRIQAKLDQVLRGENDLEEFFREDRKYPFFLKNLERVQGDERDAIILSAGYGKTADGRMQYRWGPVLKDGGERRLNVAVTRARKRMTLITSFSAEEVNPDRVSKPGGKLLCAYLKYADSGGGDPGQVHEADIDLNPFERDVRDRLRLAGIQVIPQYGVGGYRIDFAARHPRLPGRMVLAIEADGASYHSARNARERDRLRQQHLEGQGWRFHRIWSTDWFSDPDAEIAKVRTAYDQAVFRSDHPEHDMTPRHSSADPRPRKPVRLLPRPAIEPGQSIDQHDHADLVALARWIASDGRLRTEDDTVREMMRELGFQKLGSRIDTALRTAIRSIPRSAR